MDRPHLTRALAAVVACGLLVLLALTALVGDASPPGAVDRAGLRWAGDVHVDGLARAVTDLGRIPVTGAVVLGAALLLVRRGRIASATALPVATLLTSFCVHRMKGLTDRPRPEDGLTATAGSSFPSGHSANAVAFTAVALALLAVLPGRRSRAAALAAGGVLTVAIGLSRVELRAHYPTDVLGGWALGAAVFALVALAVGRIRHDPRPGA